ncbi:nucleotide-binding universal stress UspA family protein [Paucimonas lemoignei]|uniref:Nucleotide-binding universal stress UspA family protein n=1 Tax=Paucimonas lemoignei TaxID=29443 RepID=A0A4R3I3M3_PAULE|nr:universal stress protein [Paucimonas lemoignei]TCS39295.1 nucleotide-binding universal stress UspA family protein [Paucimonas lemoignei]
MNDFDSILLPLDGSAEAAKGIGCAVWLARALGATLHVLHATDQPLPVREALDRLHMHGGAQAKLVVHQLTGDPANAVLEAIDAHGVKLLVMSAGGESASTGNAPPHHLGKVAQSVLSHVSLPVMLLPLHYRETVPWTSMLAAASGEAVADQALEAAARLAAALGLKIAVVHSEGGPLSSYADTMHHEYPLRIVELVQRGLASCRTEECRCVEQVILRPGDPATVLLEQVAQRSSSVLALGWHGAFAAGRALVFKRLLEEANCALLLVRGEDGQHAHLMVGNEIDD